MERPNPLFATSQVPVLRPYGSVLTLNPQARQAFFTGTKKIQQMNFLYSALTQTSATGVQRTLYSQICSGFGLVLRQFPQSSPHYRTWTIQTYMLLTQRSSLTGITGQGKKLLIFGKPQTIQQHENMPSG